MDTKQFLGAVLGGEGYYCIAGKKNEGSMKQQFHDSLDAVTEAANNFDGQGHDVYFALSSFVDKNRKSDNARDLKSLFLDIDCGADKPYQTQSDALKALRTFRKTYTLPKPYIINSGRGLHVYWTLDKSYSRDEWKPVASQLKTTCLQDGLDIDPVVTDDAARLLRIPNTRNFKGEQPLPVVVVLQGESGIELTAFADKLPSENLIPLPSYESSEEDDEGMEYAKGKTNHIFAFKNLIGKTQEGRGCAHFERAIRTPDELTYPEWLHVLSIAKRCDEDGVGKIPAVHAISKKHTDYSAVETDKIASSINYPHRCATFDADFPDLCSTCPNYGKIKSPITLCRELRTADINEEGFYEDPEELKALPPTPTIVEKTNDQKNAAQLAEEEPPPSIPEYPGIYVRRENRGVVRREVDQDTGAVDDALIYRHDLFLSKILDDPEYGITYEVTHVNNFNITKRFLLSQKILTSGEDFRKEMNAKGITLLTANAAKEGQNVQKVQRYIAEWIQQLQDTTPYPPKVKTQFGWTKNCKSFVLGGKEIFKGYEKENPPGVRTSQYIPMFAKQGTLEEWKKAAKFYGKEGFEQHQYMFGLSFGSPLMEFVSGISGAIYNLNSPETGIGKTTGMWGGASVWGDHKKLVLVGKDTDNSSWNRAEVMKNLPLYIDEVSNYDPKDASDFCYGISDGTQKNRMSSTGKNEERYRGEPWNLSCGTTGNSSITEEAGRFRKSPKGESGRVISFLATKLLFGSESTLEANKLNDTLAENYGWAGEIYIKYVINNLESVKARIMNARAQMTEELDGEPSDRFWIAQGVTTYVGCGIAKELGLIDWDLDNLYAWIKKVILAQKNNMAGLDTSIQDIVAQFYMDNYRSVLRIPSTRDNRSLDDYGAIENVQSQDLPLNKFVARHETDTNEFFIRPVPFKEWLGKQKYPWGAVEKLMQAHMKMKHGKKYIAKGIKMDSSEDTAGLYVAVIKCQLGEGFRVEGDFNEGETH